MGNSPPKPGMDDSYTDHLAGTRLHFPPRDDGTALNPLQQRCHLTNQLQVIAAAGNNAAAKWPTDHEQQLPNISPVLSSRVPVRVRVSSRVLRRLISGVIICTIERAVSPPSSVHVDARSKWRWARCLKRRVMGCHCRKFQVRSPGVSRNCMLKSL